MHSQILGTIQMQEAYKKFGKWGLYFKSGKNEKMCSLSPFTYYY